MKLNLKLYICMIVMIAVGLSAMEMDRERPEVTNSLRNVKSHPVWFTRRVERLRVVQGDMRPRVLKKSERPRVLYRKKVVRRRPGVRATKVVVKRVHRQR